MPLSHTYFESERLLAYQRNDSVLEKRMLHVPADTALENGGAVCWELIQSRCAVPLISREFDRV